MSFDVSLVDADAQTAYMGDARNTYDEIVARFRKDGLDYSRYDFDADAKFGADGTDIPNTAPMV